MTETTVEIADQQQQPPQRNWSNILLWVVVIGVLALSGWGLFNNNKPRPQAGNLAPEFEMSFFDGYEWEDASKSDLSDMQGKIVVLNFWASWCTPCRAEADLLEGTWQKYKDQDVIFLGIAYADSEPKAYDFLEEFSISYPNAPDLGGAISPDYEITEVPETFFIDRNGEIFFVQI